MRLDYDDNRRWTVCKTKSCLVQDRPPGAALFAKRKAFGAGIRRRNMHGFLCRRVTTSLSQLTQSNAQAKMNLSYDSYPCAII